MNLTSLFKRWTPRSLLEAALNKLTPKNWAQGDFHHIDEYSGRETFCVVGMATKLLGLDASSEYDKVENFLRESGLDPATIEDMNDSAESLEDFKFALRKHLSLEGA